jgi:Rha family phage regulatory protein
MRQLEQTITTLEIAEMMEVKHWQILRKLDGTKKVKGIIQILSDNKIVVADFFQESSYTDEQGKERPCYKVTKLGCDFLANKFNGEKGIVFTARYVKRFADMEKAIKKPQVALPKKDDLFADCYISKQQLDASRGAWFRKNNWKLKIIMEQFGWTRKFLYHKILVELSDIYDLELEEKFYVQRFGYRPEYKLDLLDGSKSLARLATGYINYLLTEEGDY